MLKNQILWDGLGVNREALGAVANLFQSMGFRDGWLDGWLGFQGRATLKNQILWDGLGVFTSGAYFGEDACWTQRVALDAAGCALGAADCERVAWFLGVVCCSRGAPGASDCGLPRICGTVWVSIVGRWGRCETVAFHWL